MKFPIKVVLLRLRMDKEIVLEKSLKMILMESIRFVKSHTALKLKYVLINLTSPKSWLFMLRCHFIVHVFVI